jgi:hypothetical protein
MDKRTTPGERVVLLARALGRFDLEAIFLSPEARELLDRHGDKPSTG